MAERAAGLRLDLDHEHTTTASQDEVELVPPYSGVRVQEAVAAESVVPKGDSLAPVHATSW
jgi:hypothetical protein